jgi:hypothetical protein
MKLIALATSPDQRHRCLRIDWSITHHGRPTRFATMRAGACLWLDSGQLLQSELFGFARHEQDQLAAHSAS